MFYIYILQSLKTNNFYIGYTSNIKQRLIYHNGGLNRSTKNKGPWILKYKEEFLTKTEAIKRERFLKKQRNRQFYKKLITGRSSDG